MYLSKCMCDVCVYARARAQILMCSVYSHTHTQVSSEETEQAVAVQKRMKTLKKICRARAETRWYERDR